jgi:hypothetical protein
MLNVNKPMNRSPNKFIKRTLKVVAVVAKKRKNARQLSSPLMKALTDCFHFGPPTANGRQRWYEAAPRS